MNFPENLFYSKDHEWIRFEGETAFVGITDYAQKELGEIVYVDITTEGETLARNDVFGTIEAVKTVSDLLLPVAGEITEINAKLDDQPELVNQDPYGAGWIIKIAIDLPGNTEGLFTATEYKALLGM
jgi:glycine cleavage system H protein